MNEDAGYSHFLYAESLKEFGTPRRLHNCGGSVLQRSIDGFACSDAMGCYPLFSCKNWNALKRDLDGLGRAVVSLTLVTDPFGDYDKQLLRTCFQDVMAPYKKHYIIDLSMPPGEYVCSHHRRKSAKALQRVEAERCREPYLHAEHWCSLYRALIERHGIRGIAAFSESALCLQLRIPGIVAFRALHEGQTIGMVLWYIRGDYAYYHLGAYSSVGYELSASYALFWVSLEFFTNRGIRFLTLGAGPGLKDDVSSGLARFKKGWSTGRRQVYLCGRIFDRKLYDSISSAKKNNTTDYFPAYRSEEHEKIRRERTDI